MSDYKRGKNMVIAWAAHWDAIADVASSRVTVEAKLIEYGQAIRTAFVRPHMPEILMTAMPSYVRVTHRCIMDLPAEQRETMLVWHFGDDDERWEKFGKLHREPHKMIPIYKKIGRKHRAELRKSEKDPQKSTYN